MGVPQHGTSSCGISVDCGMRCSVVSPEKIREVQQRRQDDVETLVYKAAVEPEADSWPSLGCSTTSARAFQATYTSRRVTVLSLSSGCFGLIMASEAAVQILYPDLYDFTWSCSVLMSVAVIYVALSLGFWFFYSRLSSMHRVVRAILEVYYVLFNCRATMFSFQKFHGTKAIVMEDMFVFSALACALPVLFALAEGSPMNNFLSVVPMGIMCFSPHANAMLQVRFCLAAVVVACSAAYIYYKNRTEFLHQLQLHRAYLNMEELKENAEQHARQLEDAHAALADRAHQLEQARQSEGAAYSAVNHCVKRVMCETVTWCDAWQNELVYEQDSLAKMDEVIKQIKLDNLDGFKRCKMVLTRQQIASGKYVPVCNMPQNVRQLVQNFSSRRKIDVRIAAEVPQWVLFDPILFDIVFDNAIHNAFQHGKQGGHVGITVEIEALDVS